MARVDVEGTQAFLLAEHLADLQNGPEALSVRLLPAFDPYVVAAYRHAAAMLPGEFKHRVYKPQGWISPVLLINGRMDGVWRQKQRARQLDVTIEPFVALPASTRQAAESEAERVAQFYGTGVKVTWA